MFNKVNNLILSFKSVQAVLTVECSFVFRNNFRNSMCEASYPNF